MEKMEKMEGHIARFCEISTDGQVNIERSRFKDLILGDHKYKNKILFVACNIDDLKSHIEKKDPNYKDEISKAIKIAVGIRSVTDLGEGMDNYYPKVIEFEFKRGKMERYQLVDVDLKQYWAADSVDNVRGRTEHGAPIEIKRIYRYM